MPRFRTRVREITANRWHDNRAHLVPGECRGGQGCENDSAAGCMSHLHTMHDGQIVILQDGDWIVPEPDGIHFYAIKDEVMRANYEQLPPQRLDHGMNYPL